MFGGGLRNLLILLFLCCLFHCYYYLLIIIIIISTITWNWEIVEEKFVIGYLIFFNVFFVYREEPEDKLESQFK